jgi:hypothetical protein
VAKLACSLLLGLLPHRRPSVLCKAQLSLPNPAAHLGLTKAEAQQRAEARAASSSLPLNSLADEATPRVSVIFYLSCLRVRLCPRTNPVAEPNFHGIFCVIRTPGAL